MKITIITVCRNAVGTIRTAMESVAAQKGAEVEYIVVDGGSTDGTAEEVKRNSEKVKSKEGFTFKWISEKDKGMYDAINKGIGMATGEVIGILNADDVLAEDDTLARIVRLFDPPSPRLRGTNCSDCSIDGCYGDIRFVRSTTTTLDYNLIRNLPTVRYCSGKWFRPWMFRFGTQTAHPSTFFRRECFEKWGMYSLDYGMYGDFELLCRFIWKNKAKMKYLPMCTAVMRMGGASTNGWRTTLKINQSDLRALKANGCWSCLPMLYLRYFAKVWGFVFRKR